MVLKNWRLQGRENQLGLGGMRPAFGSKFNMGLDKALSLGRNVLKALREESLSIKKCPVWPEGQRHK